MTREYFLCDLIRRDVRLGVSGDSLTVDAPADILTDSDLYQLRFYKADLISLLTSKCEWCSGIIQFAAGQGWRHSWCEAGCTDDWEASEGWLLTVSKPGKSEAWMRVCELLAIRHCPDGCGQMILEDCGHDVWYCPDCELWAVAGKVILSRAEN